MSFTRLARLCGFLAVALVSQSAPAQQIAPVGGVFTNPRDVAVDGAGNVFVADPRNDQQALTKIPPSAGYSTTIPLGTAQHGIWYLAVDRNADVFTASLDPSYISELLAAGDYGQFNTIASLSSNVTGLAIDSAGDIFYSDTTTVKEILSTGNYATTKTISSQFTKIAGLTFDGSDNLFVLDSPDTALSAVTEIKAAGGYSQSALLPASLNQGTTAIALDHAGNVFVGGTFLQEIVASGGYTTVKSIISGYNLSTDSMAIDASGNIFLLGAGMLREFSASSNYSASTMIPVATHDQPNAIALDGNGNLYVGYWGSQISQFTAASGYQTLQVLEQPFTFPGTIALDQVDNLYASDGLYGSVQSSSAASGYAVTKQLATQVFATPGGPPFYTPGIVLDGVGNIYVSDGANNVIRELLASGGYTTIATLGSGLNAPAGLALDSAGDLFVADSGNNAVKEILAVGGSIPANPTIKTLGSGFSTPLGIALDAVGNVYVGDTDNNAVKEIRANGGYSTVTTLFDEFNQPQGVAVDRHGNVFVADTGNGFVREIKSTIYASVLPGSRAVQLGDTATIFATMINTARAAADNCQIRLPGRAPSGLTLDYQTTDAATNAVTGTPDTPVTIPGNNGVQTFVLSFHGASAFSAAALQLDFGCDAGPAAAVAPGVDTVDLSVSSNPVADIIALAATTSNNGIVSVPNPGSAAFSVATSNVGVSAPITVSVDTGGATLPVVAAICQSNPSDGQCLAPPASSIALSFAAGAAPTFSVFLQAAGAIPLDPAGSRIFVRFKDAAGGVHGSTSVAIESP